jgi:RNA polymerase sigma-70 factor (ECF subfamily)
VAGGERALRDASAEHDAGDPVERVHDRALPAGPGAGIGLAACASIDEVSLTSEADFRAAYRAHSRELYAVALRGLNDRGMAEDAVQETFIRAWRAADRYDPSRGSPRTWLFAILRSVVIDQHRRLAARPHETGAAAEDELANLASPDALESAIVGWQVEQALRRLSPEHRQVLVELRLRGRAQAELAQSLGVPVGTIKSRVHYALLALRVLLEEQGVTP